METPKDKSERRVTPSPTVEIRAAEAKAGLISRIVGGIFFMLAGAGTFAFGIKMDSHPLMIGGATAAVFGAMLLPSVFDSVKPIVVFFFPNGIPFLGGRRATDPPAPPVPPVDK
jgi:hypothetical protein